MIAKAQFGSKLKSLPLVLNGLLIVALLAVTFSRTFYLEASGDLFFSIALASSAIVYLHVRPFSEVLQLVTLAAGMVGLETVFLKVAVRTGPVLALAGLASILLTLVRKIWSSSEERVLLNYALVPSLLLLLFGRSGSILLEMTERLQPKTLDLTLYAFDASLGIQPAFRVGQLVSGSRLIGGTAALCYYALPAALMLVYAQQLIRRRSAAMTVFLAFFIAGPVGVVFYNLFPACGPIYLVGSKFPWGALSMEQVRELSIAPAVIPGARNAFPSLHMAWALLAWWYSEGLPRWTRCLLLLFLAGTVLATLGLGEHYLIDLIVAFPFALMIQAICAFGMPFFARHRFVPFASGLLCILGWIVFLRIGLSMVWVSPFIPWTLIAFTTVASLLLQRQMQVHCAKLSPEC